MSLSIVILTAGALATVQDLGRRGALRWGVGTSGAMDPMALAAGNLLLGNDEGAAAIEVQVFPFKVRFESDGDFALTGADAQARLDGQPLLPWWRHRARAGQVLHLAPPPRNGAWPACRSYLCLAGGVAVPPVLGSRSTQLRGAFGGHEGRALRAGDRIGFGTPASVEAASPGGPVAPTTPIASIAPAPLPACGPYGLVPPALTMPLEVDGVPAVRVLTAAEYLRYTERSRAALWACAWRITPHSDRYGYRLAGEALEPLASMEMRSHGIVPGVIQVPPGGQPIVQMRDAQPSGGYPKVGTVIEADLWRLGQAPIGSRVRFVETTWDEALAALDANRRWLAEAKRLVGLAELRRAAHEGARP